ncbi:hypothetical protein DFJ73DRAFT_621454, partial [Zopfochytrium polystomum]
MVAVTRGRSNGTRFAAFATSAALVILLFAHGPSPTSAQSCLSISGSSACPDFTAYSISQKDPDSPKSVADFDTYITSSLVSIINTYGCNLTSADSLRYLQSSFCGLIIDTAKSDGCNQGISSSQLCVSTVKNFVSSLQTVFADSTLCPNPLTTQMNTFTTMFTTLQGRLTSDDPAVCIVGENAEGSQCGFPTTDAALDYCNNVANGNDQCCTKVAGFTGTVNPPSQVVQATTQTTAAATTQQAVPTTASAPTQTAKSTTSNSSTSSAMSPVMMIGIGVGAILIIVVATVLVVRSRRQKGKKVAAGGYNMSRQGAADGETYEVVYNYIPQLSDEIYLYVGDPVVLKCRYDDGWAYGLNLTTNEEGSFPIACLAGFSESDP